MKGMAWRHNFNIQVPIFITVLYCLLISPSAICASANQEAVSSGNEQKTYGGISFRVATDEELDAMRGGFLLPNGLMVNISIEKRVYQNGVETYASYFETPQNLSLLQSSGLLGSSLDKSALNTIVQNDLDNQILKTLSTINIELSNMRAINRAATQSNVFRTLIQPGLK